MSILEDLYYGNLDQSNQFVREGSEYQKLSVKLAERIDELRAVLNDDQKKILDQIYDLHSEINCISEKENYIYGFRIGAQITWDVLQYSSPNFI